MLDHSQSVKHSSRLKVREEEVTLGYNVVRLGGTGLPPTQILGSLRRITSTRPAWATQ